jgi:hypothetical protein
MRGKTKADGKTARKQEEYTFSLVVGIGSIPPLLPFLAHSLSILCVVLYTITVQYREPCRTKAIYKLINKKRNMCSLFDNCKGTFRVNVLMDCVDLNMHIAHSKYTYRYVYISEFALRFSQRE